MIKDGLHYVKIPLHHIVIDFDLKDENDNKSLKRNTEVSKGGEGLHLHYAFEELNEAINKLREQENQND